MFSHKYRNFNLSDLLTWNLVAFFDFSRVFVGSFSNNILKQKSICALVSVVIPHLCSHS